MDIRFLHRPIAKRLRQAASESKGFVSRKSSILELSGLTIFFRLHTVAGIPTTRPQLISPWFTRMKTAAALLFRGIILSAMFCACSGTELSFPTLLKPGAAAEARTLDSIFENYFEAYLDLYPSFATEVGDHRYDDQLEIAISVEHISAQRRIFEHTLARLAAIDRDLLDSRRRLLVDVLERTLRLGLEGQKFNSHLIPVRQLASLAVGFFHYLVPAQAFSHSAPSQIMTIF